MDGEAPTWAGRMTWKIENKCEVWLDGYVEGIDGECYNLEFELYKLTKETLFYFSDEYRELVFIMINGEYL